MTKKIFTLLAIMLIIMSANKKLSAGFGTRAVGLPPLGVGYFSSDCFYYNNYFLCNQSIFFANTFLPPDPVPGAFSIVNSNDSKFQSFYNYWGPLVVLGGTSIKFTYKSTVGKTNYYDTEMLSMNYSWGLGIGAGYMLRESPTLASIGTTAVTDVGNGFLYIESFFDLYTELSIDGGTSWIPGSVSRFTLESNCPISTDPCVDLVNEDGTCVPVTHYCQPSTDPCFDNICQNGVCVLFPHICQPLPDPCFINVCKGDGNCYAISQTPTVTAGSNSPVCIGGTMNLTASATDGAGPPYVFS